MSDYIVMPFRFAARYQREAGFDPFDHMRQSEALQCRREMVRRAKDDLALEEWSNRDIDDTKK